MGEADSAPIASTAVATSTSPLRRARSSLARARRSLSTSSGTVTCSMPSRLAAETARSELETASISSGIASSSRACTGRSAMSAPKRGSLFSTPLNAASATSGNHVPSERTTIHRA